MSRRAWMATAAGVALAVALVAALVIGSRPDQAVPLAEPTQGPTTAPITAPSIAAASAAPLPEVAGIAPGDIIATISGDTVDVYDAPGDGAPRETLGRFSYYGNVRTFMGLETAEIAGEQWIHAQLPEHPNNTIGWIKADQVTTDSTTTLVNVYLDEREVDLINDGTVELTSTAVIGATASPTPLGAYFIADPVDFTANPTGTYGAYALGLSAYSETLETFKGALPQIALHGTTSDSFFGEAVSNGCVRLPDETIRALAAQTALGTPVVIYQSRADAA
ncbi:L,D-transpeptidase [Demequina aurantiaca]|uniref:L,D-transpeptidase n=1 Tax=Demequina aurantiaca TaxID=676200 RepID=UPI003D325AB4